MKPLTKNQLKAIESYKEAFEVLVATEIEFAIDCATKQEYGGESTTVLELFSDNTFRWLPSIGNLYNSQGLLLSITGVNQSDDEDIDEDGSIIVSRFYDNTIDSIRESFEDSLSMLVKHWKDDLRD
jgi:hypothetical protein